MTENTGSARRVCHAVLGLSAERLTTCSRLQGVMMRSPPPLVGCMLNCRSERDALSPSVSRSKFES
jgi:hypothetical protein